MIDNVIMIAALDAKLKICVSREEMFVLIKSLGLLSFPTEGKRDYENYLHQRSLTYAAYGLYKRLCKRYVTMKNTCTLSLNHVETYAAHKALRAAANQGNYTARIMYGKIHQIA